MNRRSPTTRTRRWRRERRHDAPTATPSTAATRSTAVRPATAVALLASLVAGRAPAEGSRQERVAREGTSVMPFDLDRTTHRFTPEQDGLREEVISDDPKDVTQIRLIREHLEHEGRRFRRGDYGDPARIHGTAMPRLGELTAGAGRITLTYTERPDGAALRFRTTDPALVEALHAWGEAQVSDHGDHAEHY
ncbi:aspartate carbamoyltransferase [Streptomyces sp. NPDC047928]|uniref:aspartate carbamoyltransferase n=1 Tax=unclassified Streptomyces TaxID=2593676 RepID=UPI0037188C5F